MTGAGISAESGVPTFREALTGLWANYDPTELATPQAFERNPTLVWQWYQTRRAKILDVKPNPGHYALAALANRVPEWTLITQNVDGLHQVAGSRNVIELHGNIRRAKCFTQHHLAAAWPDDLAEQPPRCKVCGSLMRPDVVWFQESLPEDAYNLALQAATSCDVFLSIGTSSVVYPAAALATLAMEHGACVVEINPNRTPLTDCASFSLTGRSGELLPQILECLPE